MAENENVEQQPKPKKATAAKVDPAVREAQHPSLTDAKNGEQVEVAERSSDIDTANEPQTSAVFRKVFVLPLNEWDVLSEDGQAEIHRRNITQVRQFAVGQGVRPDAAVAFVEDIVHEPVQVTPRRWTPGSVELVYEVHAVPAAVAEDFDVKHVTIPEDGPTATELAEFEATREQRIRDSHAARLGSDAPAGVTA